jgi:transglycosylase-like protein with SLT domain
MGAVLLVLGFGITARGDVRLMLRPDGSKVIYNVGSSGHGSDYRWLARQRNRRSDYDALIDRYASQFHVDPVLVRAVIQVESDFNPNCVSRKGARGLMQLMPGTAKRYGVSRVHDPEENIRGGVRYLSELLTMFNSDLRRAIAAYNAGEGAVTRYGGVPPYEETYTYVKKTLTVYYGRPYGDAESYAPRANGPRLRGGFTAAVVQPLAVLPGMRYLGTH